MPPAIRVTLADIGKVYTKGSVINFWYADAYTFAADGTIKECRVYAKCDERLATARLDEYWFKEYGDAFSHAKDKSAFFDRYYDPQVCR